MSRNAQTIKETREAVVAIVTLFTEWQRISEGGRSLIETLGLLKHLPAVWEAVQNADQIPAELADLDGLEADELISLAAAAINVHIDTHEMRLRIDKILIAFHAIADATAQWRGVNPPRALPV
jgi:hypothetical protein